MVSEARDEAGARHASGHRALEEQVAGHAELEADLARAPAASPTAAHDAELSLEQLVVDVNVERSRARARAPAPDRERARAAGRRAAADAERAAAEAA